MVNQNEAAGEGGSEQRTGRGHIANELRTEARECEKDPEWPVLRRTVTSRGAKDPVENPFPKLKLGKSYETFRMGKGSYRPTHAKSRKKETLLEKRDMWDTEYAPGITCGQVWCLLNGGDAEEILADTRLTQRAKRAILAQKDLTNKAALERIIKGSVGDSWYDQYYSDVGTESDNDSDDDSPGDSGSEEPTDREPNRFESARVETPARKPQVPRQLRFRDETIDTDDQYDLERDHLAGVHEINQHLEALHLGTPGQRPKITSGLGRSFQSPEVNSERTRATLEDLLKRDQEMRMLKKAKLKNTTVKGKVRKKKNKAINKN